MKTFAKYTLPVLVAGLLLAFTTGFRHHPNTGKRVSIHQTLAEYGLFLGLTSQLKPAPGVINYEVNSPLFSDYSEKIRFIRFPEGATVNYDPRNPLDLPVGTIIAKTFFFPKDARNPKKGRTLVETRLLIRQPEGWETYPYIWDEEQMDANLSITGGKMDVSWIDKEGQSKLYAYSVPNMSQCKGCHAYQQAPYPIGVNVRQLNRAITTDQGEENQLVYWKRLGIIAGMPHPSTIPRLATAYDPSTGDLDTRVRAWLDVNCGYCHNEQGSANVTGLFLDIFEMSKTALGVYKPPIFAGRATGGLQYNIVPGKPDSSILYYRIISTEPDVQMPELGKKLVDVEGAAMIREWIEQMK